MPYQVQNDQINYAKLTRGTTDRQWKVKVWCGIGSIVCNWIAVILYTVIVAFSTQLRNRETFNDLTIYTQGIRDWKASFWSEFDFSTSGMCQSGWESFGNEWLGTVWGNYTNDGVEKTDPSYQGQIRPVSPVW